MTPQEKLSDRSIDEIAAKAAALRDCAASVHSRLRTRQDALDRLRAELAALRSIAETPPVEATAPEPVPFVVQTPPAPEDVSLESVVEPAPEPVVESAESYLAAFVSPTYAPSEPAAVFFAEPAAAPVIEPSETVVAESASTQIPPPPISGSPSVVVFKVPRSLLITALPILCLVVAFLALARFHVSPRAARQKTKASTASVPPPVPAPVSAPVPAPVPAPAPPPVPTPAPVVVDAKAAEALALVQRWRMAGDQKPVFERLGSVVEHPGGVPAWSSEMTDEGSYLVIFREAGGTPIYAFEANLKSKVVRPTPEAADRLTLIRVRDEASAMLNAKSH